ncbi:hypothetical protein COCOR_07273 [Corallococcus coralloides DSM 2259]|uniref:WGR domain-containing protein n=1 Tax=Corallococcus coralloides (strain ATCC 25202 / DSM 2259 / NBRC 100086 / M2) TaxID=1144275 RepID=H8MJY9_CORCM|nr:hypothetical protein [Corallococcus coralloides]AFE07438.1 hypothetical protein COCOR_07273 [Corallococcus coralloides DSM 2259]
MSHFLANEALRSVVLYHPKPTEGWRYAVYTRKGGILDGRLLDSTPSTSFDEAQARMEQKLVELFGRPSTLRWEETSPGWWTGEALDGEA